MNGPPTIPADDRGFALGDGLFETLLVEDGAPHFWDEHVARLAAGCDALGLPAPDPEALSAAAAAALAGTAGRLALRISVTAGGGRGLERPEAPVLRIVATVAPAAAPARPAELATASVRRNDTSPAARLKTLAYLDNVLARAQAARAGADEAVMLNTRGDLACCAAANLFWIDQGRLYTPALDCGVLAGTVRGRLIAAAEALGVAVAEVRTGPESLAAAEAVLITNSLIGVRRVRAVDGRSLAPHALAERLVGAVIC